MKLTKHVGIDTANSRVALIMTVLPDTEDCLVVNTDRLPSDLKENFTHILGSQEGQTAINLADVLARRLYSDSGKNMLQTLHEYGYIRKASIDEIHMTPSPAYKIPLRTVLVESNIIARPVVAEDTTKFNPHHYNAQAANVGEALGTARNLLIEADLLEQSAREKREQAYNYAPSLRPGAPAPTDKAEPIDIPFTRPEPAAEQLTPADLAASFSEQSPPEGDA